MLTSDDLQQIRQVVREEISSEVKPLRAEIQTLREDIRTVDMKVEMVANNLETFREDTMNSFVKVVEAIEQNDADYKQALGKVKN